VFGFEQTKLVVMPQHPGRDLAEPGEIADFEHACSFMTTLQIGSVSETGPLCSYYTL
jgi:hypothetical protein